MKATTRRKLEMGARALAFSQKHPDPSEGYAESLARLQALLTRGTELAWQQLKAQLEGHGASLRKRELRRMMRRAHLAHLTRVARIAAADWPELQQKFVLPRGAIPYSEFLGLARTMASEAESRRELLVRYGLTDTILRSLRESLRRFDEAMDDGIRARWLQVGASAELVVIGNEIVKLVRSIDTLNRFRFARDSELMAAWKAASHVVATPHSAPDHVNPAA